MLNLDSNPPASLRFLYKLDNNTVIRKASSQEFIFYAYFHRFVIDFQRRAVKVVLVPTML